MSAVQLGLLLGEPRARLPTPAPLPLLGRGRGTWGFPRHALHSWFWYSTEGRGCGLLLGTAELAPFGDEAGDLGGLFWHLGHRGPAGVFFGPLSEVRPLRDGSSLGEVLAFLLFLFPLLFLLLLLVAFRGTLLGGQGPAESSLGDALERDLGAAGSGARHGGCAASGLHLFALFNAGQNLQPLTACVPRPRALTRLGTRFAVEKF